METEIDQVKRKIQVFFDKEIPVHIVTKSDSWINGYITEVSSDFCMVWDRKDGKIPVFFLDIRILETFEGDISSLKKEGKK